MDNNPISGSNPENNQNDSQNNMASLLEQEGLDIDFPKAGEIKQGVIASITNTPGQILVGIGGKSEGVISGREFDLIPPEDLAELKVGQEIPVYVISHDEGNANTVLSYMRAREEVGWQEAEELLNSRNPIHSSIIGYNKGGLIVPVAGLRGFVPASQISLTRRASVSGDTPEQRWGKMISQEIDVCLIEIDRERHRLILSERAASTETHDSVKSRVIEELVEGEAYNGRVTSLADFGAFVNINGADGLVHLSEISWEHIQHPGEALKVGQEVKVKVISIDRDKKRIGLSIRQLQHDPWSEKASRYNVGQLVEGTITQLTKFGAFARLDDDIEGLIHISEISEKRIEHPREVLHEGDTLTLRVIKIDPANHRIGLSLRKVESMAYADMDWQTLNESLQEEAEIVASPEEPESALSAPEVSAPESTEPEAAAPEAAAPESTAPESTEPEAVAPESAEPEAAAPVSAETDLVEPKSSEAESAESEKE